MQKHGSVAYYHSDARIERSQTERRAGRQAGRQPGRRAGRQAGRDRSFQSDTTIPHLASEVAEEVGLALAMSTSQPSSPHPGSGDLASRPMSAGSVQHSQ
eukprot:COSAG06_NODE_5678_length_3325_cov_2.031308_3_plen_100_part_00